MPVRLSVVFALLGLLLAGPALAGTSAPPPLGQVPAVDLPMRDVRDYWRARHALRLWLSSRDYRFQAEGTDLIVANRSSSDSEAEPRAYRRVETDGNPDPAWEVWSDPIRYTQLTLRTLPDPAAGVIRVTVEPMIYGLDFPGGGQAVTVERHDLLLDPEAREIQRDLEVIRARLAEPAAPRIVKALRPTAAFP